MPPVIEFTNWYKRNSDYVEQKEPFRKYYFLCEGANTERWYFKELINNKKNMGIHPLIDVRFLEKTDEDKNASNPKKLLELAKNLPLNENIEFDKEHDKIILVFDLDIYKNKKAEYNSLIEEIKNAGYITAITNPSFELFLLLHVKNSYRDIISADYDDILKNDKIGGQRYVQKLLSDTIHINSKTNSKVGALAKDVDIAIEQEKLVNQDLQDATEKLSSNVANVIEMIKEDRGV